MFQSLFDIFDTKLGPSLLSLSLYNILPWLIPMIVFIPSMVAKIYLFPTRLTSGSHNVIKTLYSQTRRTQRVNITRIPTLLMALFSLIAFLNLIRILPFTLPITAHISFALSLAFPVWLRNVISGLIYNPYKWLAILTPLGTPMLLAPFLVIVETTRIIIRFITLALRLAANITVGHVVLTALTIYSAHVIFSSSINIRLILVFIIITIYTLFEFAIAILQAFIFFLLSALYANDHPLK